MCFSKRGNPHDAIKMRSAPLMCKESVWIFTRRPLFIQLWASLHKEATMLIFTMYKKMSLLLSIMFFDRGDCTKEEREWSAYTGKIIPANQFQDFQQSVYMCTYAHNAPFRALVLGRGSWDLQEVEGDEQTDGADGPVHSEDQLIPS